MQEVADSGPAANRKNDKGLALSQWRRVSFERIQVSLHNENGTTHKTTVPDTPQHNGVAQRLNRVLVDMARTMMRHKDVDQDLFGGCHQDGGLRQEPRNQLSAFRRQDAL